MTPSAVKANHKATQIQGVEKESLSLVGRDFKVTLQKSMKGNKSGHFCKLFSTKGHVIGGCAEIG